MMNDMTMILEHALFGDGERTNCGRGVLSPFFCATSFLYDP